MPNWKKVVTSGSNAAFNSLIVSNTITGSISGSLTGSLLGTASWAEYVVNINTSSLVTTSSFNAFTASINTFTSSYNTGSFSGSFTGSLLGTSSWATVAVRPLVGVSTILPGSDGSVDSTYYTLVIRDTLPGTSPNTLLAATASLKYSGSLDLLYTTASWARESLTASYALSSPGITPQGNVNEIQYNVDGTNFGGVSVLTYDGSELVGTGRFDGNLRLGVFRGTRVDIPSISTKSQEVLVYTQQIPADTFINDDIIRIHYRVDQNTSDTSTYRIYIANSSDFSTISGSQNDLIANITSSAGIKFIGMKRDLNIDGLSSRTYFINSGSTAVSDDTTDNRPVSLKVIDWAADQWIFFSALPNDTSHTSKALSYSIERI